MWAVEHRCAGAGIVCRRFSRRSPLSHQGAPCARYARVCVCTRTRLFLHLARCSRLCLCLCLSFRGQAKADKTSVNGGTWRPSLFSRTKQFHYAGKTPTNGVNKLKLIMEAREQVSLPCPPPSLPRARSVSLIHCAPAHNRWRRR